MPKKLKLRRRYSAEINRCVGDNIRRAVLALERRGYNVERLPHLTGLMLTLPRGGDFDQLKADLARILQPRRGSLILHSSSGRAWLCSMRGNRPGDFVRLY